MRNIRSEGLINE